MDIMGIGACVADTLYILDGYPREDTKQNALEVRLAGGGPAATGIVAAARAGCSAAWLGVLSEDFHGHFLAEDFENYGVDISAVSWRGKEYRSFTSSILLNQRSGSRTCIMDRGTLPPYRLDERGKCLLSQAKLLMVDGNELDAAVEAAQLIHEAGGRVLYDAGGLYPNVERLLRETDILIPSAEFAKGFTGKDTAEEAAAALYETCAPEVVVVTDGADGGVRCEGGEISRYPAFPVKAVDSNGAGDVFHGAFAAAAVKGYSYEKCAVIASMTSSLKCRGLGARESIPDFETVICALRENGIGLDEGRTL